MLALVGGCSWQYEPGTTAAVPAQWLTSLAEARSQAQSSGKVVLVCFTGRDWCEWCMKLKAEVFDTQEFKDWAEKNVILLEVDLPNEQLQDNAPNQMPRELLDKYWVKSLPTIIFTKSNGDAIGRLGYVFGGPKAWIAMAERIIR